MYQKDMGGRSSHLSELRRGDEDNQFYNRGISNTADSSTHMTVGTETFTEPT